MNGGLTEEQTALLDTTPGWRWKKPDEFVEQFENFKNQFEKWDGEIIRNYKDKIDKNRHKAALWIIAMRNKKKKNHSYLTPERIKMLDECEYWSWTPTTFISFDSHVEKWKNFYELNKRLPSMGSETEEEVKLARWQNKMRIDFHKNEARMTDEKIATLNSLEGWVWNVR